MNEIQKQHCEKIKKLIQLEQEVVPFLNRHLEAAIHTSGLDKKIIDEITTSMQKQVISHIKHVEILRQIQSHIESKVSKDVL